MPGVLLLNSDISVLVDWLTFSTRKYQLPEDVISDVLKLDVGLFEAGFGMMFYQKSLQFDGISVFYEPIQRANSFDMGICVSMSGSGCRAFERYSESDFVSLFKVLSEDDTSVCSRVDLACDDHSGLLDLDLIAQYVSDGRVRSRLSKYSIISSFEGGLNAKTIYLGSEKSAYRCRIYDKAKENGCPEGEIWNRFEIVLRDHYSDSFIDFIQSMDLGLFISSFLKSKIDFIELDDSNISRCSLALWWTDFIDHFVGVEFSSDLSESSDDLTRLEDFFLYQYAPTFSLLYDALGFDFFHKLYHEGKERRSSRKNALLDDWFKKKGKVFV